MRVRTAKKLAQRIDLYYFTRARGMRRWRILLSALLPGAVLIWIGATAAAGSRKAYSAGPVSSAHAFAEKKCEVCHAPQAFRAHTTDKACLTCHDAPAHAANQAPPPACSACHQEHRGRLALAKTDDRFCLACHVSLQTHVKSGPTHTNTVSDVFPAGHPEFGAVKSADPGHLKFNHAVHLKPALRGPRGPEQLECLSCHVSPAVRTAASKRPVDSGLMAPANFSRHCARCHPLFFDERIEQQAPHDDPAKVIAFVEQALRTYISEHPGELSKPDVAFRRVPLNFPRRSEAPAKNAAEWLERRLSADERVLWLTTCGGCHEIDAAANPDVRPGVRPYPRLVRTNITQWWMPRASFNHAPHGMVTCESCHAARGSTKTSDVLLPDKAVCATCHQPSKGAESRCFECHRYHDWTQAHPVVSPYSASDFK